MNVAAQRDDSTLDVASLTIAGVRRNGQVPPVLEHVLVRFNKIKEI
jgi:hypothetical protein